MNIRIGIVDDHPVMILGVIAALGAVPGMRVVASGTTVRELVGWRLRLDVVLLDLTLADRSSPAHNVLALEPVGAQVIAYTSRDSPQLIREVAAAGAAGMISKSAPVEALAHAVRTAAAGGTVASAQWAGAIDSDEQFVDASLSAREAEVLTLYASGQTADRVAASLFIAPTTVHDHIRRIRAKYAASHRAAPTKVDLLRRAIEDGLVLAVG